MAHQMNTCHSYPLLITCWDLQVWIKAADRPTTAVVEAAALTRTPTSFSVLAVFMSLQRNCSLTLKEWSQFTCNLVFKWLEIKFSLNHLACPRALTGIKFHYLSWTAHAAHTFLLIGLTQVESEFLVTRCSLQFPLCTRTWSGLQFPQK